MTNLPNEDREKRYVATGPNQGITVRGVTGFFTYADKLDYGVNVQGHKCGVYGESLNRPGAATGRITVKDGAGVCGVGDDYGVVGKGDSIAGVYGEKQNNGTGVFGVATAAKTISAIGVAGINQVVQVLSRRTSRGVGIVGATDSGQGFGVVGLSVKELTNTTPTSVPTPGIDPRTGRPEIASFFPLSSGIGVFGASDTGTGVYGQSSSGRGGTFESTALVAQVHLVPSQQETLDPGLPRNGKVGDLLVIRNTAKNVDGEIQDRCSLWLCIPEKPDIDDSSQWQEVSLGRAVLGTL